MEQPEKRFTFDELIERGYIVEKDSVYVPTPGVMIGAWTNGGALLTFAKLAPVKDEILDRAGLEYISGILVESYPLTTERGTQWILREEDVYIVYEQVLQ